MVKKLGFLSTVEGVAQAADTKPPAPDLVGNDWKYWAKTKLPTNFVNSSGDGVLLLETQRSVRIAWRVGLRFSVDLSSTEATGEFAEVEFASGVASVEDFVSAIGKLASHLNAPKHLL